MSADEVFNAAVEYVKTGPKPGTTVPNSEKLKVYALYKQATVGDVNTCTLSIASKYSGITLLGACSAAGNVRPEGSIQVGRLEEA